MEYEDITKNTNEESNPVPEAAMSTIAIPPVKQTDDKFMKKRNKLENLLGNIKNKICHSDVTPKSDENNEDKDKGNVKSDIENNAETKSDKVCKVTKGNDDKSDTDNRITVCTTVKDSKQTSECLPEEKVKEKEIKTNETEDEEKEEGTKKEDGSKEESRDARETTTSESTEEDVFLNLQNEEFLRDLENIDIPIEEEKSADSVEDLDSQDSFLELNRIVIEENKNPLASEKVVEHTASEKYTTPLKIDNANEDFNIKRVKKRPLSDPDIPQRDAIKIYFVDAVANTENAELTTKISKKSTLSITTEKDRLSSTSVDSSKDATNDNTKVNKHDTATVTDTKVSFKEDETASIKLNPEIVVKSESNEVNMNDPNEFADKATNMTSKNKDLNRDIAINDCTVKNVDEKAFFRKVNDESNNPDNNKSNHNKNLNKEQLLAVYKIITDNNYREKYIKTIKDGDETEHHNKTKSNDRLNKDTLEFYFKKYKSAQKRDKQKQETQALNKNEIEATKPKSTQDGSKNEVSENCKRETCLSIISDVKSVKYCLKCSSIFETDACDYCNRENLATPQGTLADTMTKHCKSCVRNGINIGTT
uniref:Uncharacterized protein n=1 Tax=Pectinophora gossypiella TaxID=13191 RepID=A0A1E1W497_PECGO